MFRKGGEVGGGIMTGINRENYSNGTPRERYEAIVQKYAQPAIDPISQLLIQGGLRGMSQTGGGGTLGNIAMAFEQPTAQLFQNLQRQKDVKRETELAGLEMDLAEEERQKRIAREEKIKGIIPPTKRPAKTSALYISIESIPANPTNAAKRAKAVSAAEAIANPFPAAAVVFPTASKLSVL